MTTSRPHRILEIIWIITGILCLGAGIRMLIVQGYNNRIFVFLLMAAVSFLYAWFRHTQRKKN